MMETGRGQRIGHEAGTRIIPLAYEVYTGSGNERRVVRTMSARRANQTYERLIAEGNSAELWLGSMQLKKG
jgi:hypothetical protein